MSSMSALKSASFIYLMMTSMQPVASRLLLICLGCRLHHVPASPYDTMEEVIGTRGTPGHGSLMEWGVTYRELELAPGGGIDWETLKTAIVPGEQGCSQQCVLCCAV